MHPRHHHGVAAEPDYRPALVDGPHHVSGQALSGQAPEPSAGGPRHERASQKRIPIRNPPWPPTAKPRAHRYPRAPRLTGTETPNIRLSRHLLPTSLVNVTFYASVTFRPGLTIAR